MATTKDYRDFILEQLNLLDNITVNDEECNKDNCITAEIDLGGYTSGYYDIPVVFKIGNSDIEILNDAPVFVKVLVRNR